MKTCVEFITATLLFASLLRSSSCTNDVICETYSNCGSCTASRYQHHSWRSHICEWNSTDQSCRPRGSSSSDGVWDANTIIYHENDCPLFPPYNASSYSSFLSNWMGVFGEAGVLDYVTLMNWSLPGTHDSLSYDLSLEMSKFGFIDHNDKAVERILEWMRTLHLVPGELEEFVRLQAKTQQLTIRQQLDNGIRFLDIRIMKEDDDWYSIHFLQSKHLVRYYLYEIRGWLSEHPTEIIVLWLSQHGNPATTGEDQYPGVSPDEKQAFWKEYTDIFQGYLVDTSKVNLFTTPVASLVDRNFRLVTFCSDYLEFTNASAFALDAARIQNHYQGIVFDQGTLQAHLDYLQQAAVNNAKVHAGSGFSLFGMNTAVQSWQVEHAAERRFLGVSSSCASHMEIPGLSWCPQTLLDIAQLASFYNQVAIESAYQSHWAFPNAFYLDALDQQGTVKIGSQLLDGAKRTNGGGSEDHEASRYAYVDTVLAYNLLQSEIPCIGKCKALFQDIELRRTVNPLQRWEAPEVGRHVNWPPLLKSSIHEAHLD